MGFELKDSNDTQNQSANQQSDLSLRVQDEINPPMPMKTGMGGSDDRAGVQKETKQVQRTSEPTIGDKNPGQKEPIKNVTTPGQALQGDLMGFLSNQSSHNEKSSTKFQQDSWVRDTAHGGDSFSRLQPEGQNVQPKKMDPVAVEYGRNHVADEIQSKVKEQKLEQVIERKMAFADSRSARADYVEAMHANKIVYNQTNVGTDSPKATYKEMTGQPGSDVITRGNIKEAMDQYSVRTGPNVVAESFSPLEDAAFNKKVLEQARASSFTSYANRSNDQFSTKEMLKDYGTARRDGIDPGTRIASDMSSSYRTMDRSYVDANAIQRELRSTFDKPGAYDTIIGKVENPKYSANDWTSGGTYRDRVSERITGDPGGRPINYEGIGGGMHTMPGPGSDGFYTKPPKENLGLLPDNGRLQPGPGTGEVTKIPGDPGRAPGDWGRLPGDPSRIPGDPGRAPGDPGRLTGDPGRPSGDAGKVPGGGGALDPSHHGDSGRGPGAPGPNDPSRPGDAGKTPSSYGPAETPRAINNDRNPAVEPSRPNNFERPSQCDNSSLPKQILPTVQPPTGMDGQRPVETGRVRPSTDSESRPVETINTNRPQCDSRRPESQTPEVAPRTNGSPVPPTGGEHREAPATQTATDKGALKPERKDEETYSRARYTVGPGSSPGPEANQEARSQQVQPMSRSNLDKIAGGNDLPVMALPPRPSVTTDTSRPEIKQGGSPESQIARALLEGNISKTTNLSNADSDRKVSQIGGQIQSDLTSGLRQPLPARTTGLDGVDQRSVRPDGQLPAASTRQPELTGKPEPGVTARPLGQDGHPIGAVRTDLSQVPGRTGADIGSRDPGGAHGQRPGEGGMASRLPGDIAGAAGQRGAEGPAGRLPTKLNGSIDEQDQQAVRGQRNGLISPMVPLSDRLTLISGKLNGELTSDGKIGRSLPTDKLTAGDKRYMTGAEIALAAVIAAGGIRRLGRKIRSADTANEEASEELNPVYEYAEQNESSTAEQCFSMSMMEKLGLSGQGELQKSRSDQVHKRPTYLVGKSETLVGIAEKLFEDPDLGWLIADVNAGGIKETVMNGKRVVELQDRQQIDLPVWQDIIEFYENRPEQAIAENLVTVVVDSQVNSELMNLMLNPVVGANTVNADPFGRMPVLNRAAASPEVPASASAHSSRGPATGAPASAMVGLKQLKQLEQLERQLSEIAGAVIAPFTGHWPKPPATLASELTPKERPA